MPKCLLSEEACPTSQNLPTGTFDLSAETRRRSKKLNLCGLLSPETPKRKLNFWTRTQHPRGLMVNESLRSGKRAAPLHPLSVGLPTLHTRRASCQRETCPRGAVKNARSKPFQSLTNAQMSAVGRCLFSFLTTCLTPKFWMSTVPFCNPA